MSKGGFIIPDDSGSMNNIKSILVEDHDCQYYEHHDCQYYEHHDGYIDLDPDLTKNTKESSKLKSTYNPSILKSVYCNYRGRVTVYDVHGEKVHKLSGQLTYEKYQEIEARKDSEITEFEGVEDYNRIAGDLKPAPISQDKRKVNFGSVGIISFTNTSNKFQSLNLFGAYNAHSGNNYGNDSSISIYEDPNAPQDNPKYMDLIRLTLQNPIMVSAIRVVHPNEVIPDFKVKRMTATGAYSEEMLDFNISNGFSVIGDFTKEITIDHGTSFIIPIEPNEEIQFNYRRHQDKFQLFIGYE